VFDDESFVYFCGNFYGRLTGDHVTVWWEEKSNFGACLYVHVA
jgi:hypothetical protein